MTDVTAPPSPLEQMLTEVRHGLSSGVLGVERLLGPVEGALLAYRRALEAEVASAYAAAHSLRFQRPGGPTRAAAAERLRDLVLALPELRPLDAAVPDLAVPEGPAPEHAPSAPSPHEPPGRGGASLHDVLPRITAAAPERSLVVIGALSGRKRSLPEPLASATEWIDTSQGGAHAVGNLPARIRQGRVLGVVICDQAVSHKHTEPVLAAARAANVPVGFAGKGGNAGIAKALRAIEQQLGD
jgi:hypothetical protein